MIAHFQEGSVLVSLAGCLEERILSISDTNVRFRIETRLFQATPSALSTMFLNTCRFVEDGILSCDSATDLLAIQSDPNIVSDYTSSRWTLPAFAFALYDSWKLLILRSVS
jgi:hypothetical protein